MTAVSLTTLVSTAQQRAAMENDPQVTAAEWAVYVNAAGAEVYHHLVQTFGFDRWEAKLPYTITGDKCCSPIAPFTPLDPTAWISLLAVHLVYPNGSSFSLEPFSQVDRDRKYWGGYRFAKDPLRYRPVGDAIEIEPAGVGNGWSGTVRFVPDWRDILTGASFDFRVSGAGALVALGAAVLARGKKRLDVSDLQAEYQRRTADLDEVSQAYNRGGAIRMPRRSRW